MDRVQADKLLMNTNNDSGSYLVRDSESASGGYSLSVRSGEEVIHYRVQKMEGMGYFVGRRAGFESLFDLIAHYRKKSDGLCAPLKAPCFIEVPQTAGLSKETNKACEIDRNSICLVKRLGAGQFGEVWQGVWNGTTEVAVKTLKPGTMGAQEFLKEATLMKQLRHPKLVQFYAVCAKEEPIYIITELMKQGSLLEYLRGNGRSVELPQLIDMGAQVAAGMAYLEEKSYVHRNLAARNVLISDQLTCKVADYGLVVVDESYVEENTGIKFIVKWTAPEAAMYGHFTIKSDVWSFGILLHELITYGRYPYPGMNNAQVLEALQTGYRMPCPTCCPEQLYDIMNECWKDEAATRPTFDTLQWKMEDFFIETIHANLYPN